MEISNGKALRMYFMNETPFLGPECPRIGQLLSRLNPLNLRQHKRRRASAWALLPADRYAVGSDQAAPIGLRIWVHKGGDAGLAAFLRFGARFDVSKKTDVLLSFEHTRDNGCRNYQSKNCS